MTGRNGWWLALLVGCSEYEVVFDDGDPPPLDDCSVEQLPGASGEVADSCSMHPDVVDPWSFEVEWTWSGGEVDPSMADVVMTPLVARRLDTDGDGRVTRRDEPSVIFVASGAGNYTQGVLTTLAGSDGSILDEDNRWSPQCHLGLVDVDRDGAADVFGAPYSIDASAMDAWGEFLWTSDEVHGHRTSPVFANIDNEGGHEVLYGGWILDAQTGDTVGLVDGDPRVLKGENAVVVDLDLDGVDEVAFWDGVYTPSGEQLWEGEPLDPDMIRQGNVFVALDADGDPEGELFAVGIETAVLYDHDGVELERWDHGYQTSGHPCVADLDGDGAPELAFAGRHPEDENATFYAYELDGTQLWERPFDGWWTTWSGCSAFDFDADGAYEVLLVDRDGFAVLDGATGAERFTYDAAGVTDQQTYPVVADIDLDGSAEIVVPSNTVWYPGGATGLVVLGHPDDEWPKGGDIWSVHDYAVTNVDPHGAVPVDAEPHWQRWNMVRARPPAELTVDYAIALTDSCYTACDGDGGAAIAVEVRNLGETTSPEGTPISLYRRTAEGEELVETQTLPAIEGGWSTDTVVFEAGVEVFGGADAVVIRVDDDGTGAEQVWECDERNNELVVTTGWCG